MSSPTPPRSTAAPRRALAVALLSGAIGAAAVLVAAGQTWGGATTAFARGALPVEVTGSDVSGLPSALALVGLAALVAVFAVRRAARSGLAVLLALCGLGTLTSALRGAGDTSALRAKAAEATGLSDSPLLDITHSAWPYLAVLGGVLLLLTGVLALGFGRHWPAMSGRYERSTGDGTGRRGGAARSGRDTGPDRPEDLWKALDRGEDPTGSGRP